MLNEILVRILLTLIGKLTVSILFNFIVYHTYAGQLSATIDSLDRSSGKVDGGVTTYATCPFHRCIGEILGLTTPMHLNRGRMLIDITTVTAAINVTADSTSINSDRGIFTHNAKLGTAIDITRNGRTAANGKRSRLRLSQFGPDRVNCSVKKIDTTHATAIDVSAILRLRVDSVCRRSSITDSATTDSDSNVTMFFLGRIDDAITIFIRIFLQLTIFVCLRCCEVCTHRCYTSTAIDRTQHGSVRYGHIDITANSSGCLCHTTEATTATEDVAVHV